jgi:uncharacterized YccA/Bax inhibitor family protein
MANPTFSQKTLENLDYSQAGTETMSVSGTIQKIGILLLILVASAWFSWDAMINNKTYAPGMIPIGFGGGLITAIILVFKKEWGPALAPTYAICEGLALGAMSSMYGILSFYAVVLTFGVLIIMYGLYAAKILQATQKFAMIVISATGGVFLLYLSTWILGFFGIQMPFIHESGWMGIALSGVIVVIAAMNLILDFGLIEEGANHGAPKYFEWYAAFGLLVTLVWLYLEILRFLSKISSRD